MMDFLKRIFGQTSSSATAKERLRLVLMTDHLALAPELIEAMKRDLVDVISRYVEVDRDRIDVTFERQEKILAMLANIPIVSVNRPTGGNGSHPPELPRRRRRRRRENPSTPAPNPAPAT
jgi:cell division topological specificity factor